MQSARARRFSEEVLSLTVAHFGEVMGVASLASRVFALTDTLQLYEYDLDTFVTRTHELVTLAGFKYSWGGEIYALSYQNCTCNVSCWT